MHVTRSRTGQSRGCRGGRRGHRTGTLQNRRAVERKGPLLWSKMGGRGVFQPARVPNASSTGGSRA